MKTPLSRILLGAAIATVPLAAALGQSDMDLPRWMANMARKQHVVMNGIPAPYRSLRDQRPDTHAKLWRGRDVFDRHCASCHGWSGHGNGPDAFALVPAPADLEWLARTPAARSQPYIYWSIAEGGGRFDSEMPAFKQTLSKDEIWAVTAYLRAGMPHATP